MDEETTETTEQAEPVLEEAPAEAPETSETTEETSPPDVGEALGQMRQQLSSIEERLPGEESEEQPDIMSALLGDETDEEEEQGYEEQEQGQPDEAAALRELIGEEIRDAITPVFQQQEASRREGEIRDFAKDHPRLNEPGVLDAVAQRLEAAGLQPEGFPPNPEHVRMAYMAYEAEAAASAEGDNPAEVGQKGATLETGAGPGAPEPEVDPAVEAYMSVINWAKPKNAFVQ